MSAMSVAEARQLVSESLAECGTLAQWTRTRGGAYDPATGSVAGGVETTSTVAVSQVCCVTQAYVDGDTICIEDFEMCIQGDQSEDLQKGDKILTCGRCYVVIGLKACMLDCEIIAWTAFLRG